MQAPRTKAGDPHQRGDRIESTGPCVMVVLKRQCVTMSNESRTVVGYVVAGAGAV